MILSALSFALFRTNRWMMQQPVFEAGRGTLLAKLDIKSAYRNVPVHPSDRHLLGIQWQGETFVDTCLPFGLRSAPKLFNAVADALDDALEWVMVKEGGTQIEFVIHYLDDFLFGGRPGSEACSRALDHGLRLSDSRLPGHARKSSRAGYGARFPEFHY